MTTSTLEKTYQPTDVESRTYQFWEDQGFFKPEVNAESEESFSIVIPPPNVTGTLHMGHALDNTIQDILIRWHRMLGHKTLWMPGTDHAGIATQSVVERQLKAEGKTRYDLGREDFVKRTYEWSEECQGNIFGQFRRLGVSPDWQRQRFTLDEGLSQAVRKAFVSLYEEGLIYRGEYIVNWDPETQSAISDIETDYSDEDSFLWQIAYPLKDGSGKLVVATTRPETMFGDVAVAVNPEDERYKDFIGKTVTLPLTGRDIPVIADSYVDMSFGTGSLKITPAHDPNDFEIGKRHKLEPIVIMDEKGYIKPLDFIPEAIQGLERFEARKVTEKLLDEQDFLVGKVEHTHRVGRAQRSGAIVEPLLSKQWFVKTGPLAKTCLEALDAGEIQFIPERWTKDYLRWMSNIHDWCISRQLWWGHQIPAWYCSECEEVTVSMDDAHQCSHCRSDNIKQDNDVLDTWFSSGLWPFSTMGWPDEEAQDFKDFYPTSVLVTGFDIIFFWVARMTMFGHYFTKQSPFHTVYIHGLIRDEKGQKMSKSKGNTVDPVEAIETYGCDGFRFALADLLTYGGQDIKLAKDKLEVGRLFANKLWNASRFVLMNIEGVDDKPIDENLLSSMDRWILSRFNTAIKQANEHLSQYKFSELTGMLYEFIWNAFCDWYVEYAKKQLKDENADLVMNTKRVLLHVLNGLHKLMHPVMPFITEEIWQKLPHRKGDSIMVAVYPQSNDALINNNINAQIDYVLEVVRAMRNIRQSYGVAFNAEIKAIIETSDNLEKEGLEIGREVIEHFITLSELTVTEEVQEEISGASINVVGKSRILIPLEGLIDVEQEVKRLQKKVADLHKEQDQINKMMSNHEFLEKAPAAVIEKNKTRLNELIQQVKAMEEQLEGLTS